MKNIRTAIFLVICLVALGVFATEPPSGQGKGQGRHISSIDDRLKVLSERLNLSQDQRLRIRGVLEDQLSKMQAIEKDTSLSQAEKVSKARGLRDASSAEIRNLLNENQRITFDEMQRERAGQGSGQGYGQGGGKGNGQGSGQGDGQGRGRGKGCQMPGVVDHLNVLSEKLNLSQEQQARLTVILEDRLAQLQAIRKNESLSPEDKMSKIRSLREASAASIRDQLSDGQRKKFDEMQQDPHERMKERQERGEDCSMIWIAME